MRENAHGTGAKGVVWILMRASEGPGVAAGAVQRHRGRFDLTHGGTLFLDKFGLWAKMLPMSVGGKGSVED